MRTPWSKCLLTTLAIFVLMLCAYLGDGEKVQASSIATVSSGQIVRMDYASDGVSVGGTFDFQVSYPGPAPNTAGFLNAVADLDLSGSISIDEWIIQNVPLFLDSVLATQPLLSIWFDPASFTLVVGNSYGTWATIESSPILDNSGYPSWDYSYLPAIGTIWGENDLNGEPEGPVPPPGLALETDMTISLRGGVPDISQKPMECGPTSAANSLRWLAIMYNFENKIPADDDDLIKELMKAMTGSDARPFPGLSRDQMLTGKKKYVEENKLPLVVKGGGSDPDAVGANAFDFIVREMNAGEDVEMCINWPGGGAHWVTVVGYGVNGDRLFLAVHDPDDGKTGTVTWELKRDGTFVNPEGMMNRAVSESYSPPETIPTLSQWGIIGMILMLAGCIIWITLRKRIESKA